MTEFNANKKIPVHTSRSNNTPSTYKGCILRSVFIKVYNVFTNIFEMNLLDFYFVKN